MSNVKKYIAEYFKINSISITDEDLDRIVKKMNNQMDKSAKQIAKKLKKHHTLTWYEKLFSKLFISLYDFLSLKYSSKMYKIDKRVGYKDFKDRFDFYSQRVEKLSNYKAGKK